MHVVYKIYLQQKIELKTRQTEKCAFPTKDYSWHFTFEIFLPVVISVVTSVVAPAVWKNGETN